jgi:O-antigen/teichoic acid export membrane protein
MNIARAPGSNNWEEKTVRHILLLTSSTVLTQILLILRGFIMAKFLGPSLYGLWHGLRVIINNSDYSTLGIYDGMKREVPYYKGKGDYHRIQEIIDASFFSGTLLSLITSFILIEISFLFSKQFD